jgi:hypothetical protein
VLRNVLQSLGIRRGPSGPVQGEATSVCAGQRGVAAADTSGPPRSSDLAGADDDPSRAFAAGRRRRILTEEELLRFHSDGFLIMRGLPSQGHGPSWVIQTSLSMYSFAILHTEYTERRTPLVSVFH